MINWYPGNSRVERRVARNLAGLKTKLAKTIDDTRSKLKYSLTISLTVRNGGLMSGGLKDF